MLRPRYSLLGLVVFASVAGLGYMVLEDRSTRRGHGTAAKLPGHMTRTLPRFEGPPSSDVVAPLDELEIERRISHRLLQGPLRQELAAQLVPAIVGAIDELVRETQGKVGGVDCRGDGCVVEITWASTETAASQEQALLAVGSRLNCQPQFGVRPGPDASGRAFLFLDGCQVVSE